MEPSLIHTWTSELREEELHPAIVFTLGEVAIVFQIEINIRNSENCYHEVMRIWIPVEHIVSVSCLPLDMFY